MIDRVVEGALAPTLAAAGFERRDLYFSRSCAPDFTQIVNLQETDHRSARATRFTLNIGFYLPELYAVREFPLPASAAEATALFPHVRLADLVPERGGAEFWYEVTAAKVSEVCQLLREDLRRYVLPWLDRVHDRPSLAHTFRANPKAYWHSAYEMIAFALIVGDLETARREYAFLADRPHLHPWGLKYFGVDLRT